MHAKILRVKGFNRFPVFDVFRGIGWRNWSRVEYSKERKSVNLVNGLPLYPKLVMAVLTHIEGVIK
jgi:hypothetical protein